MCFHPRTDVANRVPVRAHLWNRNRTYFKQFQHEVRNSLVHVEIARESGVPLTVVLEAIRLRDEAMADAKAQRGENLRWDNVWGVFDIDERPNVAEANDSARRAGIELAISNPCFELWGLLHFQDQHAHIDRHAVATALKVYMPTYENLNDRFKSGHG